MVPLGGNPAVDATVMVVGVLLIAAWLMTQLSPETLLFGSGTLRQMLGLPPVQPFMADRFVSLETAIAAEFSIWLSDPAVAAMAPEARARKIQQWVRGKCNEVRALEAKQVEAMLAEARDA